MTLRLKTVLAVAVPGIVVLLVLWLVPQTIRVRNPVLVVFLALPLILGWVPRNWIYGLRTPATLSSDDKWYRQNFIGGIVLLVWGVVWLVMVLR